MIRDEDIHYLLDTNIISEIVKFYPDFNVIKNISMHSLDMAITVLTWHELIYGTERLADGARKKALQKYIYDDVIETFPTVSFTKKAAEIHAMIRIKLEQLGKPIEFGDSQVASIAIAEDMTLVTRNTKHFEDIAANFPLKLENWFEAAE